MNLENKEFDEQFSADIMAAIDDIATLNGAGISKGFRNAINAYGKVSAFTLPDEKTILHNVKVHRLELLTHIAKLKFEVFHKNYLDAAMMLGEMFHIISQPIQEFNFEIP